MTTPSLIVVLTSLYATIGLVFVLLLFSCFAFFYIIHFHIKTKRSHFLKDFNSLWTVRILLVTFISLWGCSELLRLPLFNSRACMYHVVLSQGLFEPGFLVTLLFLVNLSIKKHTPEDSLGNATAIVFALCIPMFLLHVYFVFYAPRLMFHYRFWLTNIYVAEDNLTFCTYPLFSTIIFGTFIAMYLLAFLLSCWKVLSLVINKSLRSRIYKLTVTVVVTLTIQILALCMSSFWKSTNFIFHGIDLLVFLCALVCAVMGQGILIIRPIADALSVERRTYRLPVGVPEKTVVLGGGSGGGRK